MFRIGTPNTALGVDIGTHSIKMVQLKKGSPYPRLTGVAMEAVPEGAIVDGAINDVSAIANVIKMIRKNSNFKKDNCVACISAKSANLRFIALPVMTDEELAMAVRTEAEHYIHFPLEETNIAFDKLAKIEEDGNQKFLILLVGVRKDDVHVVNAVFKEAGIPLLSLQVDAIATINALEQSLKVPAAGMEDEEEDEFGGEENEGEVVAIISIGARTTNVSILKNGILRFTRSIGLAGNNVNSLIQKYYKVPFEEAERIKIEDGMLAGDGGDSEVVELVQAIIEELAGEIRRSFDYFKAQSREALIHRVLITGGTARLEGLKETLENEFGMDVEFANPLEGIEVAIPNPELLEENLQHFTCAMGLALEGLEET